MASAARQELAAQRGAAKALPQPRRENAWANDLFLQRAVRRMVPADVFVGCIDPELRRFGARAAGEIDALGRACELHPPRLRQTDAWGRRVDELHTSEAWKAQKRIAAEEGLVAIPYTRAFGDYSRVVQALKLYLYAPVSGLFSCPLAMTDGAAKTIASSPELRAALVEPFGRLTATDPRVFWTSGQWMTEKGGGSDVGGGTETVALPRAPNASSHTLYGYKWFSSATDADMSLTLARIVDEDGEVAAGTKGLSMFYVQVRRDDGSLNGIRIEKLKDKLGTRQMPTAELVLDGCNATLVSPPGRGIACIASMLSVTRLHNVISSVGAMRGITFLARDYASKRTAFGKPLAQHALHAQTLARMEVDTRGCILLMLELARLMGKEDCGAMGSEDSDILRLMTPVAKMYTGKLAVATASEGLEAFGGQGYMEESGIPQVLRDAQVLPIWEGTSNVMSLDVLRAVQKTHGAVLRSFAARVAQACAAVPPRAPLRPAADAIGKAATSLTALLAELPPSAFEAAARDVTVSLARVFIAALLLEHSSDAAAADTDRETLQQWVATRDLTPAVTHADKQGYPSGVAHYTSLIMEGYDEANVAKL
eukprot:TRINITY_DN13289_c0_g1_i1.p1 TRINITY_DN13289_c0_g1~~TRINITY_DN13289_c0_g1_i1.p1  ORF type:complete len:613 (+),score=143.14 TRINITY_DN13289_c0_g1_i1:54-1841(+)